MKREDLRKRIIPTALTSEIDLQTGNGKRSKSKDLIYINSYEEVFEEQISEIERRVSATDYAIMNNTKIFPICETILGRRAASIVLRSTYNSSKVMYLSTDGKSSMEQTKEQTGGIRPVLKYKIPISMRKKSLLELFKENSEIDDFELDIREIRDDNGNIISHNLMLGEYPKIKVEDELSEVLENLYNNGNLKEGITATGRWYTSNGENFSNGDYVSKHSPEFEYNGKRYARVIQLPHCTCNYGAYSDETSIGKRGIIRWVTVEPIAFQIMNWEKMPKTINPNGNEKASFFELRAEEAIIGNMPFHLYNWYCSDDMWQNSTIRGFLNGIDIIQIDQKNTDKRNGNFINGDNFLNEAFNLSREPVIEYEIPIEQTVIPDDAFNGCVTLKRIIFHQYVRKFENRVFDGVNFKYAYRTENGSLVLDKEYPREKVKKLVNLHDMVKFLHDFDYNFFMKDSIFDDMQILVETLKKYNFSIPYSYAFSLCTQKRAKTWARKSEFRFFKEKLPDIIEKLSQYPTDERTAFLKFANALGCFSKEKILNKEGEETQIIFAQKACTMLTKLLNREEMKLRSLP